MYEKWKFDLLKIMEKNHQLCKKISPYFCQLIKLLHVIGKHSHLYTEKFNKQLMKLYT